MEARSEESRTVGKWTRHICNEAMTPVTGLIVWEGEPESGAVRTQTSISRSTGKVIRNLILKILLISGKMKNI